MQLYLTKKVREQFRIPAEDLTECVVADGALGNWYVNLITIERRKTLIFMSERSLLSFLLFGVRKDARDRLADSFYGGLIQLLELEGFNKAQIQRVIGTGTLPGYSKASDRKSLGNLNELQQLYRDQILSEGGFSRCNLWRIISDANGMPQRNLSWASSIKETREILGS